MYVLRRTDQGGGWVARPGSANSYTHKLQNAATWATRQAAYNDHCPDNEVIEEVEDILR